MAAGYLGAVVEVFEGDGTLMSWVPGGLYVEEEPNDLPLPHAVLRDLGATTEYDTRNHRIRQARMTLDVYADRDPEQAPGTPLQPLAGAEKIAARVVNVLLASGLSVTGWSNMDLRVTREQYRQQERRSGQADRVYKATLDVFAHLSNP